MSASVWPILHHALRLQNQNSPPLHRPVVDYCICSCVVLVHCDVSSFTHVCIPMLNVVQTAASHSNACLLFVPFHREYSELMCIIINTHVCVCGYVCVHTYLRAALPCSVFPCSWSWFGLFHFFPIFCRL